jgi:hypothetical protein
MIACTAAWLAHQRIQCANLAFERPFADAACCLAASQVVGQQTYNGLRLCNHSDQPMTGRSRRVLERSRVCPARLAWLSITLHHLSQHDARH